MAASRGHVPEVEYTYPSRIEQVLKQREHQRHQIPEHLFAKGHFRLGHTLSGWNELRREGYRYVLVSRLTTFPFMTSDDPLVFYISDITRNAVFKHVVVIAHTLQELNEAHTANHTVDWWYRPVGQTIGRALIAIRLNGLYELTYGE